MPKPLNPMPSSAKTARRTLWLQALLMILLAGGLVAAHKYKDSWVPELAANNVYRAAVGLAAAAIVLLFLTILMRRQWRWLWVLLLLIELATMAGLVWAGVRGINWIVVVVAALIPLVAIWALLGRVARRWFHH